MTRTIASVRTLIIVPTFIVRAFIIALLLGVASPALAATTQGTLPADETWTGTVTLIGDLTIPVGRTLTIAAGTTVLFASGDTMGSGNSTTQIELIVQGTLEIKGTTGAMASLAPASGGTFYGIRVLTSGTANIAYADVRGAQYGLENDGTLTVDDSLFADHARDAIYLKSGSSIIKTTRFTGNCKQSSSMHVVRLGGGTNLFDHNTLTANACTYALYLTGGTPTVTNTIVAQNGYYGIYSTSSRTVQNNLVWDHTDDLYSTTNSNGVAYNPLFVSASNLRITSLSPARKGDTSGGDIGALPYVSDVTPTLQGKISDNMTLTAGNHDVVGDLMVGSGVTLTLAAGAVLRFAASDGMKGGNSASQTELIVAGTLKVQGSAGQNVVLQAATSSWYGPRVLSGGLATIDYARFSALQYGLSNDGTLQLSHSSFDKALRDALYLKSGTATVDHNIFRENCTQSTSAHVIRAGGGNNSITNNTLTANACTYALYLTGGTMTVNDNIIAANGYYGIYSTSSRTVQNNLVWKHTDDLYSTTNTNGITYNPLFVSAANLRITSRSPARQAGVSGGDLGALPYTSDVTPQLEGKVTDDLTLAAGNHDVVGDLWVGKGATLTLSPGATLRFAAADEMMGGNSSSESELIVEGTLTAIGTSGQPVTLQASTTSFYGLRLLSGSQSTLRFVDLSGQQYGIASSGTLELAYSHVEGGLRDAIYVHAGSANIHHTLLSGNCTQSTSTHVLRAGGGTAVIDHNTLADNACTYALYLTGGAPTVTNNIIVENGYYGIYSTSSRTVQNNLVWGHTDDLYSTTNASGISANPLFVGTSDYHLQASSPARNAATDGSDLGAFPYAPGAVTKIVITPSSATVPVTGTTTFSAQAYDASNNPVPSAVISWTASSGGTIDGSGVFTAGCTAGNFTGAVQATSGSISASADVTVQAGGLVALSVSPASATLATKATQSFSAQGEDACGNVVSVPGTITWQVLTSHAGSIDGSGLFTAGCTVGTFSGAVQATSGTINGSADVVVQAGALAQLSISPLDPTLAPGGAQAFSAQGSDSCGNAIATTPTWSVVAGGGTITAAGVFTAGNTAGIYTDTVQAQSGSVQARTSVTVTAGNVAKITLTPNPATVAVGQVVQFSAVAVDAGGNTVATTFAWSANHGTIDSTGKFTAGNTAATFADSVTVSAEGVSAKAQVVITPGPAAKVTVSPDTITIAPGGQSSFTAQVQDAHGNARTDAPTWSVSPTAAGSIDASGNFTAGTPIGVYTDAITATVGTLTGKASVTIAADALHHLELTPKLVTLKASATTVFSVQGFDAANNPVTIQPSWKVVAGGGTINDQGVFAAGTTTGTFSDTVQVSASGLSATATVVVEAGPLNAIVLDPLGASLKPGGTQQFTATGKDAWGNAVTLDKPTWKADAEAGTIDAQGLFTAGSKNGDWPSGVTVEQDGVRAIASIKVQGDAPPPVTPADDGGCSCRVDSDASSGSALALGLLLLLVLWRRRR